jgi:hypothetical protein
MKALHCHVHFLCAAIADDGRVFRSGVMYTTGSSYWNAGIEPNSVRMTGSEGKQMPIYSTRIQAYGPDGNIFVILAHARQMLRDLGHSNTEISALNEKVFSTSNYNDAIACIEFYFAVDRATNDKKS